MSHQDWSSTGWDKRSSKSRNQSSSQFLNQARRSGAAISTSKRYGAGGNASSGTGLNSKKLDEDHENLKHAKVTFQLKKLLMQERTKAGMTQKELATYCNMKPQIIQNYESGKGIPSSVMLRKIENALASKNKDFKRGTLTKAQKRGAKKQGK